jgi:hypothetical protein
MGGCSYRPQSDSAAATQGRLPTWYDPSSLSRISIWGGFTQVWPSYHLWQNTQQETNLLFGCWDAINADCAMLVPAMSDSQTRQEWLLLQTWCPAICCCCMPSSACPFRLLTQHGTVRHLTQMHAFHMNSYALSAHSPRLLIHDGGTQQPARRQHSSCLWLWGQCMSCWY